METHANAEVGLIGNKDHAFDNGGSLEKISLAHLLVNFAGFLVRSEIPGSAGPVWGEETGINGKFRKHGFELRRQLLCGLACVAGIVAGIQLDAKTLD